MRLAEAFLPLAVEKTAARLADLSEKHAATGRPLGARKWLAFRDYFLPELACGVRIEEVLEIPEPPFYDALKSQLALLGIDTQLDFLNTVGLTARNAILVRSGQLTRTLLFHEMVHVEQYRQLGMEPFARAYLGGLPESAFVYERVPLDVQAFALARRFDSGERFEVWEEVRMLVARKAYSRQA